jgi:hypothetical protein
VVDRHVAPLIPHHDANSLRRRYSQQLPCMRLINQWRLHRAYTESTALLMKITTAYVRRPRPVNAGYIIVWDVLLSGFGIQVTARGLRNFLVERYIRGKAYRVTQEPRPAISAEVAPIGQVSTEMKRWALRR